MEVLSTDSSHSPHIQSMSEAGIKRQRRASSSAQTVAALSLCTSASILKERKATHGFGVFQLMPAEEVESFGNKSAVVTDSGEEVFNEVIDAINMETNEEEPVANDMAKQRMQATSDKLLEMRIGGNEDALFLHR